LQTLTASRSLNAFSITATSRSSRSPPTTRPRRTVRARAKGKGGGGRDADLLREPPPRSPSAYAVEEALLDGRHVLVVLDGSGARLYRTQRLSATPSKLEPIINYNHCGE